MKTIYKVLSGFSTSFKCFAKHIAFSPERNVVSVTPNNQDIYLVSFPKSGSTWLNFIIANINMLMSGQDRRATFLNIHQYVPDIHDCRFVGKPVLDWPGFNIIKSHSQYNRLYPHVIYIVRNPADVLVSYYKFQVGLGNYSGSFSNFIRSANGIKNWNQHVTGWFLKSPASLPFYLIKYENLKNNPHEVIKDLYIQLGFELRDEIISDALERSSFENMKKSEKSLNYGCRPLLRKFTFMRKGVIGDSLNEIQSSDLQYINKISFDVQKELNYL